MSSPSRTPVWCKRARENAFGHIWLQVRRLVCYRYGVHLAWSSPSDWAQTDEHQLWTSRTATASNTQDTLTRTRLPLRTVKDSPRKSRREEGQHRRQNGWNGRTDRRWISVVQSAKTSSSVRTGQGPNPTQGWTQRLGIARPTRIICAPILTAVIIVIIVYQVNTRSRMGSKTRRPSREED
ncbi:hypothetical protein DFH06DRAFT_694913 [Mycena polygramma]|nr:hypothetical protein DFH06DRAFT_694913 [Mycena polygramma]